MFQKLRVIFVFVRVRIYDKIRGKTGSLDKIDLLDFQGLDYVKHF